MRKVLIVLLILISTPAAAGSLHPEKWYQDKWCAEHNGKTEVTMFNGTRCDCVTTDNAVEFDFGHKWAEAVGQALNYSIYTKKRGGIVLIMESSKDIKYWLILKTVVHDHQLPIDLWLMTEKETFPKE